jgi:hypothetical protein
MSGCSHTQPLHRRSNRNPLTDCASKRSVENPLDVSKRDPQQEHPLTPSSELSDQPAVFLKLNATATSKVDSVFVMGNRLKEIARCRGCLIVDHDIIPGSTQVVCTPPATRSVACQLLHGSRGHQDTSTSPTTSQPATNRNTTITRQGFSTQHHDAIGCTDYPVAVVVSGHLTTQ